MQGQGLQSQCQAGLLLGAAVLRLPAGVQGQGLQSWDQAGWRQSCCQAGEVLRAPGLRAPAAVQGQGLQSQQCQTQEALGWAQALASRTLRAAHKL